MTAPVFRDAALQRQYQELGYAVVRVLPEEDVRELRSWYDGLTLEDVYGIGYNVSLYSSDRQTRHGAHETLLARAFPRLGAFLVDRRAYMSTFLVKEPGGHLIPPHQDWTHCDETRHDSLMCWVTLDDADEGNGGLGFVKGSHRYFDYLRAFPYQEAGTPVDRHSHRIVPYLDVLRMKAGEAVVFNNRIIHGSLPNYGTRRRLAFSFALHPAGEPLLSYYLKPNGRADTLLRYSVDAEFYLEYNNPRLWALYKEGAVIAGYESEEVPYRVDGLDWEAFEAKLVSTGNQKDPWKVAKAAEGWRPKRPA